ncbi:MAG: hypothetical protein NC548_34790, partial [Lachnospiraceae bacterium]|nr:hypothetical protein [Lachnospiraceae bacterium]
MNKILIVFVLMFICHYLADFVFQGQIALYKQKSWWKNNYPDKKYEYDWLTSLLIHSTFWTLSILLAPIIFGLLNDLIYFVILLIFNSIYHAFIDHLKCNKLMIDLTTDQICHAV